MRKKISVLVLCVIMIAGVFVIKVDMNAKAQICEEWVARYDGSANDTDISGSIATDSLGNVYVCGRSIENNNGVVSEDYATIAYDSLGNELWTARYNSPNNGSDAASDMIVDSDGNIIITGLAGSDSVKWHDFTTIKYDSAGNELWVAIYDNPSIYDCDDQALAMISDSSGNIYVTGKSHEWRGGGTDDDFCTIKYDSDGNELWVARYNSPGNGDDQARGITLDSAGNIIVTGNSGFYNYTNYNSDYYTIAYDPDGNELWNARYKGPVDGMDHVFDIATDTMGNVYITGSSDSEVSTVPRRPANYDCTTIKYDGFGNELWVARYNGPGNYHDYGTEIEVDSSGDILVGGNCDEDSLGQAEDCLLIKYDSDGNELWEARYDGPGDYDDRVRDIAIDSDGNIFITGQSSEIGSWDANDFVTMAYDSSGNQLWIHKYNGPANATDICNAITIDFSGNVYVTGSSCGSGTGYEAWDYATIKYSPPTKRAIIDIDPDTLNLKSKGRWITCYIDLPNGYDVNDIDISTVMLEETIPAEWGDIQGETLMVKFDRSEVEDMLSPGIYNLKVSGELTDGLSFEGYSDEIRVIEPPK